MEKTYIQLSNGKYVKELSFFYFYTIQMFFSFFFSLFSVWKLFDVPLYSKTLYNAYLYYIILWVLTSLQALSIVLAASHICAAFSICPMSLQHCQRQALGKEYSLWQQVPPEHFCGTNLSQVDVVGFRICWVNLFSLQDKHKWEKMI